MDLSHFLSEFHSSLSPFVRGRVCSFHQRLVLENQSQNLTRLVESKKFYEGHFLDVWHLFLSGFLDSVSVALDLGSGCGVPGLLASLLDSSPRWILCESEQKKAEYLQRQIDFFDLSGSLQVLAQRFELALRANHPSCRVDTLVWRAVGPLEKLCPWIFTPSSCSTWNKCILFKGPAWDEEWKSFLESKKSRPFSKRLSVRSVYEYEIGEKKRKIVLLERA